jgi:hypothetical protein
MPLKTHQAIPEAQIQTQGRKNGPEGRQGILGKLWMGKSLYWPSVWRF